MHQHVQASNRTFERLPDPPADDQTRRPVDAVSTEPRFPPRPWVPAFAGTTGGGAGTTGGGAGTTGGRCWDDEAAGVIEGCWDG